MVFWNCDDSLWKLLYIQYLVGSAFLLEFRALIDVCYISFLQMFPQFAGKRGNDVNQMSDPQIWKTGVEEKVTLTSCFRRCDNPGLGGSSIFLHFTEITLKSLL